MQLLTILVPAFNEEKNLPVLKSRLDPVIEELRNYSVDTEVILLDNCSTDGTSAYGKKVCGESKEWKYVRYSRNFGYHGSLACGFDLAQGDALIVLASDLQEPPELIPKMVQLWQQGYDVAFGILNIRNDDSIIKTIGAKIFYPIFSLMSDTAFPRYATDFRIVSRRVIDSVKEMREVDRYLRGLVHWSGFRQISFTYDREKREQGESAGIRYSTGWAINAIVCFSKKPLRAMAIFGLLITIISVVLSIYFLIIRFFPPDFMPIPPTGTTALAMMILFMIGINSLFLGIIGEYVGRIYSQTKMRPLYIIDEAINIKPSTLIGSGRSAPK